MDAVLAAASYYRRGFSLYLAVRARRVRVTCGSKVHLEPGTIAVPRYPLAIGGILRNMLLGYDNLGDSDSFTC